MAEIIITLKDSTTGREVVVELPDNVPVKTLLPQITEGLGIENAEQRQLQNKTQSFDYLESDTLESKGTQAYDLCILKYETIQG